MRTTNYEKRKIKEKCPINETTYTNSYKTYEEVETKKFRPNRANAEKLESKAQSRTHLDLETFTPLKHPIPVGLLAARNELTRVNHLVPIEHIEITEDIEKKQVIKTRPRLYKSPQVSLDDIQDPEIRKMIVDYMYTSSYKQSDRDFFNSIGIDYRKIQDTVLEHEKFMTAANNNFFKVDFKPKLLLQIEMTKEQNLRGKQWEQTRTSEIAESTEHFWKHNIRKCGTHNMLDLVTKETKDEISNLVENDKLEIQHDKQYPGYAGFRADIPVGIKLRKKNISRNYSFLSTYQESYSWKANLSNNPKTIS